MRAKWFSFLMVMSVAGMLATTVSADPPPREGHGGPPPRAERQRGDSERNDRERGDRQRGDSVRDQGARGGPGENGRPGEGGRPGGPGSFDPGRMMRMLPLFVTLDADRDGSISSDEIDNASVALKKLDKNNDGKLDKLELQPNFAGRATAAGRPGAPRDGDRGPRGDGPRDGARGPRADGPRDGDRGPRADGERGPRGNGPRDGDRGPRADGPRDGDRGPRADGERGPRGNGPRDGDRGPREGGPRGSAEGGNNQMLQRLMQLDSDKNGELSADELTKLPERGQRVMEFGDRDKDGALSKQELQSMKSRGEEMRRGRADSDRE